MFRLKLSPRARAVLSWSALAICLLGVYFSGLVLRRMVLQAQVEAIGPEMPFTLESALHYRRVKMLYDRGQLPEVDQAIQYPEGIRIREIDAVSSEPWVAALARFFPESTPFPERVRWIEAGWFCLAIPLLALAVRWWTGSWPAGLVAALLYAVSLASVLRSTGQEISRENFAFPWLMAAFAAAAGYWRTERGTVGWLMAFTAFAAMTLIGWDLMQYLAGLAALGMTLHVLRNGDRIDHKLLRLHGALVLAIGMAGLLHPYYRYHGLLMSPLFCWLVATFFAARFRMRWALQPPSPPEPGASIWRAAWQKPGLRVVAIIAGPVLAVLLFGFWSAYGASYGHFGELLVGKLRFLNVKPEDPGLLTYYQRIMWVPSLHSATWGLTKWLFPYSVWLVAVFSAAAWFFLRQRPDPLMRYWLLVWVVSLAAYVLFVRFHVFVALSTAVLAGWLCSRAAIASGVGRAVVILLMVTAAVAEGIHTSRERHAMGRPNVYYREMAELAEWLKEEVAPDPVLANMGVSAFIAAYGKCSIVIHPKFEDPSIRSRLKTYGELLFGDEEKALRDWMVDLGVDYYVYSKGEFATEKPEYQMRYFVNRMDPPEQSPARRFEREDEDLRYFQRIWGNRKYVVYRILTREDEEKAAQRVAEAERKLAEGRLAEAEQAAMAAVEIDRGQEQALKILRHVGSLMEQGVRLEPGATAP